MTPQERAYIMGKVREHERKAEEHHEAFLASYRKAEELRKRLAPPPAPETSVKAIRGRYQMVYDDKAR